MNDEKEYIVFCDESDRWGKYYSNFYDGLIIGASQYEKITFKLNKLKQDNKLFGEIKWQKVTEQYLSKYQKVIKLFFHEISRGNIKIRIMFQHNARKPGNLTSEDIEMQYYKLYYQFIKHSFGFEFIHPSSVTKIRLYFDKFPDTGEKIVIFKGFLSALQENKKFRSSNIKIAKEDITEVRSHEHVLLQCLDIVLGAMAFRLNDKHREKLPGKRIRGKRTRAKEALYKTILAEIHKIHPGFNVGITTGSNRSEGSLWSEPYLHWNFQSKSAEYQPHLTKGSRK